VGFTLQLGRALLECGVSAHTLETALGGVARHLGLEGAVYATPTGFLASLNQPGHVSRTYLIRATSSEAGLAKLVEAEALADSVIQGTLDVDHALDRLARLSARAPSYGPSLLVGAYGAAAMGMAVVFGGGWREALLSALVGSGVGLAVQALRRRSGHEDLIALVGGLLSSLGGSCLGKMVPAASHPILILCGIIVLVPGLGLLVSMQELGTGHLVAGSSRLVGTGFVLLLLAFGVAIGQRLGGEWFAGAPSVPVPLPLWTLAPALAMVSLGFLVVFQGSFRDYLWTFAASTLAYASARSTTQMLGPEVGAGAAALVLGAVCNYYSRRTRRPGAVLLLPSLMLIVPGSVGFRGLLMAMHDRTIEGLQAGFQAVLVTVALMMGLLMANVLVSRRSF
jgi:uncharacterized membrane protein YjjP (DUF1212 family)